MRYDVKPNGVCPTNISFDLNGDVVTNIEFTRGCNGNLKAIAKVCDGMTVSELEGFFTGNTCGFKDTSCAEQLAIAVRAKYDASK